MNDTKPWFMSRTVWAALVTIATALLGLFGVPLDGVDDAALVDAILQAVAAVAGVVALAGRVAAQTRIE
ncbi:hypothetical protein RB623_22825 [Mesorhizobium sp. LHD-90]|uniref:hypothetical protein n=1 Tax=Mesorhizobium sp. LHD-90 TaxID=3071414 RepID=UPI0027DF4855|nr:hypothetical protein [Mesorhizobium sp. LHD-90]MDQ6436894.1 hypothetical protein [Mesorhizobium sp. LHD-90]